MFLETESTALTSHYTWVSNVVFDSVKTSHNAAFDGYRNIRAHTESVDSTGEIKSYPPSY